MVGPHTTHLPTEFQPSSPKWPHWLQTGPRYPPPPSLAYPSSIPGPRCLRRRSSWRNLQTAVHQSCPRRILRRGQTWSSTCRRRQRRRGGWRDNLQNLTFANRVGWEKIVPRLYVAHSRVPSDLSKGALVVPFRTTAAEHPQAKWAHSRIVNLIMAGGIRSDYMCCSLSARQYRAEGATIIPNRR